MGKGRGKEERKKLIVRNSKREWIMFVIIIVITIHL